MDESPEKPEEEPEGGGQPGEQKDELFEAQRMNEMRESGMTIEQIAERTGTSESTVRRRLDLWADHIGREPAEEEEIDRVTSVIFEIFGSDDAAERIGEVTGANVATIRGILERMMRREVTKAEVSRLLANIRGAVVGYFGGSDVFRRFERLFLPKRHPYGEKEIDKSLRKIAVAASGKKPKSKEKKKESRG